MSITAERAREVLSYDPTTGILTWRVELSRPGRTGSIAGCVLARGYRQIKVDRQRYLAHRLAWLITHGEWPRFELDHANGDPCDNRLCNLRDATRTQNHANARRGSRNTSGIKGVSWHAQRRKWQAHIRMNGRSRNLGTYVTKEEAAAAYANAAVEIYGEFARAE